MIFGHGDDSYLYSNEIKANFSSNCFFSIDNTGLIEHLKNEMERLLKSYPHPNGKDMVEALSSFHSISQSKILLFNGATEAIYTISNLFQGKRSAIISPTFSEYESSCKIFRHTVSEVSANELLNELERNLNSQHTLLGKDMNDVNTGHDINNQNHIIDNESKFIEDYDIIWLCNPNNPTGKVFKSDYLKELIEKNADKFFVVDQSYWMFTEKEVLNVDNKYNNLIIINSLTKEFCIPGLRLGYITACEELIVKLEDLKMPWSVNSIAIEAGKYLLSHDIEIKDKLKTLLYERERVMKELSLIEGLECYESDTHFFLCKSKKMKVEDLKDILANKYGILIRNAENFGENCKGLFRIAVLDEKQNTLLINAIREIMVGTQPNTTQK